MWVKLLPNIIIGKQEQANLVIQLAQIIFIYTHDDSPRNYLLPIRKVMIQRSRIVLLSKQRSILHSVRLLHMGPFALCN